MRRGTRRGHHHGRCRQDARCATHVVVGTNICMAFSDVFRAPHTWQAGKRRRTASAKLLASQENRSSVTAWQSRQGRGQPLVECDGWEDAEEHAGKRFKEDAKRDRLSPQEEEDNAAAALVAIYHSPEVHGRRSCGTGLPPRGMSPGPIMFHARATGARRVPARAGGSPRTGSPWESTVILTA